MLNELLIHQNKQHGIEMQKLHSDYTGCYRGKGGGAPVLLIHVDARLQIKG